jgi:putative transposase
VSAFIDSERGRFGVEPICQALGVSASAYYQRAGGERSARSAEDEPLVELIRQIHARNYFAYGSWRMWKALRRAGEQVGRGRVERLMRRNGIHGAKRRGKPWRTTIGDPQATRRPDLVQRDFTASRPDELWCADFSYLRCWEGPVFFAFVIDVYSRMIVGWQFANHMRTDLVLDALRMALARRSPGADVELVHHSDAGSQYTSFDYSQTLDDHGVLASIGSVGDCYDNAMIEAFWSRMQVELLDTRRWKTRVELANAIFEYIEIFHNRRRRHSSLGMLTPIEFELQNTARAAA